MPTTRSTRLADRLSRLVGFGTSRHGAYMQAAVVTAVACVPILLFCEMAGTAVAGPDVPLWLDLAVLSRLLLVLPLLVAAAPRFDAILDTALAYPMRAGLVLVDREGAFTRASRCFLSRRDGDAPVLVLASLAALGALAPLPLAGLSTWAEGPVGGLSAAGLWYAVVALPLLRFAILLWLWRLVLWTLFLARLAKLDLALEAAHPDGAAGLGYLGFVQQRLALLLVAGSLMLSGSAANRIVHDGKTFDDLMYPLLAYTVIYPMLLVVPLLLLTPELMRVKRKAVFAYSAIGQDMATRFQGLWSERRTHAAGEGALSSPSHSAMADFAAVHGTITGMRVIPLTGWQFATMIASACVPFLLLIFLLVPFDILIRSTLAEIPPLDLITAATASSRR